MTSESSPPPAEPRDPRSPGVFGRWNTRPIWICLALEAGAVQIVSTFADFPVVTRWWAWGVLLVVMTFVAAGVYVESFKRVLGVTGLAALVAATVAVHMPDQNGRNTAKGHVGPAITTTTTTTTASQSAEPQQPEPLLSTLAEKPLAVEHGFGRWWVLHRSGLVEALDDDGKIRFAFSVGHLASGIAVCGGALVVAYGKGWVGRFSPNDGTRLSHYHFGDSSDQAVCGRDDRVFVDKQEDGWLVALDAHDLTLLYQVPVGGPVLALAYGGGKVWVAAEGEVDTIVGFVAKDHEVVARVPVMDDVSSLDYTGGRLWVTHAAQSCLMHLDLSLGREVGPGLPLGSLPGATVAHDGSIYVVDAADGSLRVFDASEAQRVGPAVRLGEGLRLDAVDVDDGRIVAIDASRPQALVLTAAARADLSARAAVATRRSPSCPTDSG
jgi:outer membrane protein assembly factor BamB